MPLALFAHAARRTRWCWFATSLLCAPSCSDRKSSEEGSPTANDAFHQVPEDIDETPAWTDRFADDAKPALLAALAQRHAVARGLGPHRLHYTATFSLAPDEDTPAPQVGERVPSPQQLAEELTLEWSDEADGAVAFRLEQENDHARGRSVIVKDEYLYTKLLHRPWLRRPLQSDLHELWLDDAGHAVLDLVEFAASSATVEVVDAESAAGDLPKALAGRPVVVVRLGTKQSAGSPDLEVDLDKRQEATKSDGEPGEAWRKAATFQSIAGDIVLDAETGFWLVARVSVRYLVRDGSGREIRGEATLRGTVEPVERGTLQIAVPSDARPVPERIRYEEERARLLEGLAAP